MNKLSIGLKIAIGFAIILVMFIIVSTVTLRKQKNLKDDADWVTHTYLVINTIKKISGSLKDAETGQRGYLITGLDSYLEPYNNALKSIDSDIIELKRLTSDNSKQQQNINELRGLINKKLEVLEQTINLFRKEGFLAAKEVVISDLGKTVMDDIREVLNNMTIEENQLLQERSDRTNIEIFKSKVIVILLTAFACIIVIILVLYYTRIIAKPIGKLATIAEKIASGNLVNNIETTTRKDEIGVLIRAIHLMSDNLLRQITDITDGVNVLSSSASEIMSAVSQLASGAAETATSVSETTTTISEVKQTAEVSNLKATKISQSSQTNLQISKNGTKSIEETIHGMNRIKEQMISIADIVIRLSEQSQSIGEIASSVEDIAEQSNLLAVNAAIEAAKAGEHGKGFGVVAQEIKNLASRSKEATNQIKVILNDIQKSISNTVMATEQGGKAVDEGLKLSTVAGDVIKTLAISVEEAAQAAFQIASSSQQQLIGMDQINEAMEDIKEASMQTATSTRQTEESVSELHNLGEKLQNILKQYKLN